MPPKPIRFRSHPLAGAVKNCGTTHFYTDTADREELQDLLVAEETSPSEWRELRKGKLPDLDSELTRTIPLDTLYSLLAVGDFMNFQDRMDEMIRASIEHHFTPRVAAAS